MPYIAGKDLPNLLKYKYSAVDLSPVSKYILQPYWNRLVLLFPVTVAYTLNLNMFFYTSRPNFITLLGFLCIVFNTLTLIYFSPDFIQPVPNWVYFTFAIGLFIYQSFDAIDGKQARRTGTSSPLGQLFDHGCDALNTSLGVILATSALNLGNSWLAILSFSASLANFYLTTWEEFYTGTLYLGHFNGPTEGVLSLVLVYIWSGIKGASWWSQPVSNYAELPFGIGDYKLNEILVYTIFTSLVPLFITSFIHVYQVCQREKKSFVVAFLGVLPFAFFIGSICIWVFATPNILQNHLMAFFLFVGCAFGNMVGRLIVAHVVHAQYPYFNINFILLAFGAFTANSKRLGLGEILTGDQQTLYVYACFALSFVLHAHFVMSIIDQICSYLDINCLTIKDKNKKRK